MPGYALDLRSLNYAMAGDSRIENALSKGQSESEIKACIEDSLRPVFCESRPEVIFDAQIAFVRKSRR